MTQEEHNKAVEKLEAAGLVVVMGDEQRDDENGNPQDFAAGVLTDEGIRRLLLTI